jgi:hypothetical protein
MILAMLAPDIIMELDMKMTYWIGAATVAFSLLASPPLMAQGKGHDKGGAPGKQKAEHAQGKADHTAKPAHAKAEHGKAAPMKQEHGKSAAAKAEHKAEGNRHSEAVRPVNSVRGTISRGSGRADERIAAGAIAHARAHGIADNEFVVTRLGNRVNIKNKAGKVLVDLDEDRARNLGAWDVRRVRSDVDGNAPSFCRSGAGHPVWGRQWCIDKGFGLGSTQGVIWGRNTATISDIIFGRPVTTGQLARNALVDVLGAVALDRLGLHAVTLGYAEPLTGVWVAQPSGPQILQVNSGSYPVAEFVDVDRDNRAEVMLVALRPY